MYINNRECAHCGRYPNFMDLTGLVSVRTSLHVIILYTWNIAEILPNWDLNLNQWNPPELRFEMLTGLF